MLKRCDFVHSASLGLEAERFDAIVPAELCIRQQLAYGGSASIWRVSHAGIEGDFVLKYAHFSAQDNDYVDAQFGREWLVSGRLSGTRAVPIYRWSRDHKKHAYLYMPWVQAASLSELGRHWSTWSEVLVVFRALARALVEVHERGVTHRDLKPSNVLVDNDSQVSIIDFGLALIDRFSGSADHSHEAIGTPLYMSPEQAFGDEALQGVPSDAYAFGVMLFECLYKTLPFRGQTPEETMRMQCFDAPARDLLLRVGGVPQGALEAVFGLLHKAPQERLTLVEWLGLTS